MDLSFCSCSFKLNTAKHSSKRGQADKGLTSLRRGLFVLIVLNGHLAVTEPEISIERFRLFISTNMNYFCQIGFLFVLLESFASEINAQIQPDSITVNNNSCFEVFMNDIPAKEKMSLEKSWISKNFGDYKSVLQYEDDVKNTIVIKGRLQLFLSSAEVQINKLSKMVGNATDKRYMFFTIEFSNKDDRYRVRFSDIAIKASFGAAYGKGLVFQQTYDEWTDQGVQKAMNNLTKAQYELESLKSSKTADKKPKEIKKIDKEIAKVEKEIDDCKEKLDRKIKKSEQEKKWLNANLAAIFNSISSSISKSPADDDF